MVGLDGTEDVLLPNKVRAEEHEGVRRAGNVAERPALARWGTSLGGGVGQFFRWGKSCASGGRQTRQCSP